MIVIIFNSFDILGTLLIVVCFCNAGLEAKQLFNSEQAHFEQRLHLYIYYFGVPIKMHTHSIWFISIGAGMGHGGPGAFSEIHGGTLLPQCPRCGLCLWCHQDDFLPQPTDMDRGWSQCITTFIFFSVERVKGVWPFISSCSFQCSHWLYSLAAGWHHHLSITKQVVFVVISR